MNLFKHLVESASGLIAANRELDYLNRCHEAFVDLCRIMGEQEAFTWVNESGESTLNGMRDKYDELTIKKK